MPFWSNNNNAVLIDNCTSLQNLTVRLVVTRDLITLGNQGFSLQLNSYPQPGSKAQGTPQTGDSSLTWFQYVLIVVNNQVSWEIQYWANNAYSYVPNWTNPTQWWPPGYTPNPLNTSPWLPVFPGTAVTGTISGYSAPWNQVLAGSVIEIQLATDQSGNVTGATFSITDPTGAFHSGSTSPWQKYANQPEPPQYALYPIYGFQINLVGTPGANCTFMSGAGILTYSVSQGALSVQTNATSCGGLQPQTAEQSNAVYGDITPSSGSSVTQTLSIPGLTFQPFQVENMVLYVLGSNGNLWLESGPFGNQIPPPNSLQVDANVIAFQGLDGNNVFVLGQNGNLWLEMWPFGNQIPPNRLQLDGNVRAFQAIQSGFGDKVFVLGTDDNLWWEPWPTGSVANTIAERLIVDANVQTFQVLDVYDVFVLGEDGNLWWEGLPFGKVGQTLQTMHTRRQVDSNVQAFQPIDGYDIYVLGLDGNLWFETWPVPGPNTSTYDAWGNVQETINLRKIVDQNVAAFQAIDVNTAFVLGSDGNLWLETSPWGDVSQTINTRQHVDANVASFYAWAAASSPSEYWVVFVKDTNGNLWYETRDYNVPPPWEKMQIDSNVM
jgi:hypothetical protein